jgi:hypothetical protein
MSLRFSTCDISELSKCFFLVPRKKQEKNRKNQKCDFRPIRDNRSYLLIFNENNITPIQKYNMQQHNDNKWVGENFYSLWEGGFGLEDIGGCSVFQLVGWEDASGCPVSLLEGMGVGVRTLKSFAMEALPLTIDTIENVKLIL